MRSIEAVQTQSAAQNQKQMQRLILSPQMQQALHLLQLPIMELGTVIESELSLNPLLELEEEQVDYSEIEILSEFDSTAVHTARLREGEDLKTFIENTISIESSLFDHLIRQAREIFSSKKELDLATALIGNFDQDGLLTTSLEEIALLNESSPEELEEILVRIQTFDPPGIGARSRREALLIQLKGMGKAETLAFRIIDQHFDDILRNRIPAIAKSLKSSSEEIYETIRSEISLLDLHPGASQSQGHYREMTQMIIPDLRIAYEGGRFSIEINDDFLPSLRLNHTYIEMLADNAVPEETREYIQEKIASGKWLLRNIHERHQTLYRIADELTKTQSAYLSDPQGKLVPLIMKNVAVKLDLHESTIARAVANKYVDTLRGIVPLRSFFTHAYTSEAGTSISSTTVKDLLQELIHNEDVHTPLSDESLSKMIREKGIPCARRTVAKYRQELNIGNATQRKRH